MNVGTVFVCEKCQVKPAATRLYGMWICLWCFDKAQKKIKEKNKQWLEEL